MGAAAFAFARDDVCMPIATGINGAIDVAGRHVYATGEPRRIREEVADGTGELRTREAIEDANLRRAARPATGNDVREAIAVDVAYRHTHAAPKRRFERQEVELLVVRFRVEDVDTRLAAGVVAGGDDVHVFHRDGERLGD